MVSLLLLVGIAFQQAETPSAQRWWDDKVEASIGRAPERAEAWRQALRKTKPEHREGMAYLVSYLPISDVLGGMTPEKLKENLELAYQARAEVPWGASLPEPVFLDAVLPYLSVTEPRDPMRREFHDRYLPLVKHCETPGEAEIGRAHV